MASDVHLCKGANVSHTNHLHRKVPEEVDDLQRLVPQQEDENEGRNDRTEQLLQDEHLIPAENGLVRFKTVHEIDGC